MRLHSLAILTKYLVQKPPCLSTIVDYELGLIKKYNCRDWNACMCQLPMPTGACYTMYGYNALLRLSAMADVTVSETVVAHTNICNIGCACSPHVVQEICKAGGSKTADLWLVATGESYLRLSGNTVPVWLHQLCCVFFFLSDAGRISGRHAIAISTPKIIRSDY